ncbi:MAG: translation initiation factor IF-2 [Planctomycetes bacterium]|nr:translation initiation factor IF-2 [Planctomycetota bacterium]
MTKKRPKRAITANVVRPDKVEIELPISLKDLSALLAIRVPEIMSFFMKQGMMLNQNQPVPKESVELLCLHYHIECTVVDEEDLEQELVAQWEADEDEANLVWRQPIVAVLGHVDHGKTTLLDTIRKTKSPVAAQEAGGITQHIGAYVAEHNGKGITFIDTPGHEAFTEMRARGANVTDIVLLVIAADDGVMPQTKEAIQHAQAAGAHIMVAMTKIDKANANKDRLLQQLAQIEGMLPQEFGGETEVVPVSAVKGQGIDELLETITTYAELLDLKANPERAANGTVLEAKKTEGRGIVVTALIQDGSLKKGDNIIAGRAWCRVRMMFNDRGKPVQVAGPGVPVEVLGFDEIPEAGDRFYSIQDEAELKDLLADRERRAREKAGTVEPHIPTDYAGVIKQLADKQVKEVRVIIKADTQGSLQVLKAEVNKLGNNEVRCRVIRDGVGAITTADVNLAFAERTGSCVIMGFGVIAESKARALAKERGIDIRTHSVIYDLLNDMKDVMGGALEPEERENVIGMVEIRKVFRSSKLGNIGGCFVEQGVVRRNAHVRLSRDGIVLWQGELASLRRFKDDVREVRENFECGIKLAGYDDIKDGDRLEVFEIERIKRTLE